MHDRSHAKLFIALFFILALVLAACGGGAPVEPTPTEAEAEHMDEHMDDEHMDDEHMEDEHMEDDHGMEHMHAELPAEYEGLTNPLAGDEAAVAAGAELFSINCATCHGDEGLGDGPAAAGLDPKPASLADVEMMSTMEDSYLFWRITEGGAMEPFNSAMPAWGEAFSDDEIWQLVSFVRTLGQ